MNVKKIMARMKADKSIRIWKDRGGVQWLGGMNAMYRTEALPAMSAEVVAMFANVDAGQLKGSYYVQEMDEVPERYRLCDTDEREVEMEPYNLRINGYEVYKGIYGPVLIAPELLGPVEQVSGLYQRHTDDGGECYVVVKQGVFVAALIDVTDELTPEMLERLGQAYNDGAVACDEERERQKGAERR